VSDDEKLEDSLAAWVPPWQRVTKPEGTQPEAEDRSPEEDAETASHPAGDTAKDSGEIVDSLADLAYAPQTTAPAGSSDDDDEVDGLDEDDYLDVEQAEPASGQPLGGAGDQPLGGAGDQPLGGAGGQPAGGDGDDEPQRPETDIRADALGDLDEPEDDDETEAEAVASGDAEVSGGEDDDEPQRPETDFAKFAYPSTNKAENEARAEPGANRPADMRGALEAIMMVLDEPVSEDVLAGVLDTTTADVAAELTALADDYNRDKRGFELRRAAGGWRLYTRGEFAPYVERFVLDGQSVRLTQAALETLAVVAYQQPVTRSRMAAIRGVNCDGVVRTLVSRGLIEECGTQPESGAFLYRTTQLFLEKLGLDSLEQLPPLAPFLPDDVNGLVDAER